MIGGPSNGSVSWWNRIHVTDKSNGFFSFADSADNIESARFFFVVRYFHSECFHPARDDVFDTIFIPRRIHSIFSYEFAYDVNNFFSGNMFGVA